jgi:hypothetical protein
MVPNLGSLEVALESTLYQAGNPSFGSVRLDCRPKGGFNVDLGETAIVPNTACYTGSLRSPRSVSLCLLEAIVSKCWESL